MRQIGGPNSTLFSLTFDELRRYRERVRDGDLPGPIAVFPEGGSGGLVRFASLQEGVLAKLAVV